LRPRHIPWLLLWGFVGLYFVKIWIVLSPQFVNERDIIRVTQRATVLRLAESGIQRGFGETRTEFANRLAATYPEFARLTECHVRCTYGQGQSIARRTCLEIQGQTHKRIYHATSLLRQIIGRLDPRFWILVR